MRPHTTSAPARSARLLRAIQSGGTTAAVSNVTSASRGGTGTNLNLGGEGRWTALGSLEKFREMNVTLATLP
ncbi:MAG: hypothetical protein J0H19_14610, partial [Rhodospirillales bacterium]|nr:hypothetical protein [Rhodospirillales bacterium]